MKDRLKKNEICEYFKNNSVFTTKDLYDFYLQDEPDLNENTFKSRVSQLKKNNVIEPLKKGLYKLKDDRVFTSSKKINTNNYMVITVDIVDSRKHGITLDKLKGIVSKINKVKYPDLITPFTESRGDEVQALGVVTKDLPKIIRDLRYNFYPLKIRIGVGIGKVDRISDNKDSSWDMSGEAFFNAREALGQIKNIKEYSIFFKSSKPTLNRAFNIIYKLIDTVVDNWSDKQWEAVQLYDKLKSYEAGANKLGISKSAFYDRCVSAKWDVILEAEKEIGYFIKTM